MAAAVEGALRDELIADVHAHDVDLNKLSLRQLTRRRERLHWRLRVADGDERAELRSLLEATDGASTTRGVSRRTLRGGSFD